MSEPNDVLHDIEEGGDGLTKYSQMILDFVQKEIFQERKNVSVEEVVTLVAALTDLAVDLLAKFRKEPMDPSRVAEIGREIFKQMVGKVGFDLGQIGKPQLYT
jgi:hypothetical protein